MALSVEMMKFCTDVLRENRYETYLANLYLPQKIAPLANVLYAFASEIEKIPFAVSEPSLGEIRLQWWRDVVTNNTAPGGNPVAECLMHFVGEGKLDPVALNQLLAARIFDFYHDPMPDAQVFEAYLGETRSILFAQLFRAFPNAHDCDPAIVADACGHAGIVCGAVDALMVLPLTHAAGKRIFPPDLSIAPIQSGSGATQNYDSDSSAWLEQLNLYVNHHNGAALRAIGGLPAQTRSVFLPMWSAISRLNKVRRAGLNLDRHVAEPSRLAMNWTLWRAARSLSKL